MNLAVRTDDLTFFSQTYINFPHIHSKKLDNALNMFIVYTRSVILYLAFTIIILTFKSIFVMK